SRTNGEGSEVTVRGFGAGNNMVTLNGRTMPAASTFNGDGGGSRAFDFANLASEGIRGVEVYKTGKADITTGGIGATINILTARPLENDGFVASIGAKAVMDTTNRTGDDVTPEVSGLFSWANDDSTFGVALSASHQKRDSGTTGAFVNGWIIDTWDDANPARMWNNPDTDVVNAPDQGQLYARFEDIRYEFTNTERTRNNGQLTLQFAPTDDFTATVDYTFAENEIQEHLGQTGNWMQQGERLQEIHFDDQAIATPIYAREIYLNGIDEGYEQQWREQTNTLESVGVNLEYKVNDSLTLKLDVHDSEMHSRGTGPHGTGSVRMALGAPTVVEREWWFGGKLPTVLNEYDDTLPTRGANGNGIVDAGDVGSTMLNLNQADQKATVTQAKFDGSFEFEGVGRLDFGLETRDMESRTLRYASGNVALGNWDANYPGEFGDLVQPFDLQGEFDDFSPLPGYGFIANAAELYEAAMNIDRYESILPAALKQAEDSFVREETVAAYFQVALDGELGNMPFNILTGLRYETTDVFSRSYAAGYRTVWEDNNDVSINVDESLPSSYLTGKASYDNLLPSLDLTLHITDDIIGRFSTSKTIARAGLAQLGVAPYGFGAGGGSSLLQAVPTASVGNPGLLPLESTNFDISVEWYYNDASYVSVGLFEKNVINFIGSENIQSSWLDIRDATAGPRVLQAAADLEADGFALNDDNLHGRTVYCEFIIPRTETYDMWFAEYGNVPYGATQEHNAFLAGHPGGLWNIVADDTGSTTDYRTSVPNNPREAKIHGMEFALQHIFGDTGFGVAANYTLVRGDVGFDNMGAPGVSQFALVGLSDTANVVGMYENDQFQARIAYNWRDKYLNETNRGSSANPRYIEAYSQIDVNLAYAVTDALTISLEGLNVTGENSRSHGRNKAMMFDLRDLGPRYQLGARYTF